MWNNILWNNLKATPIFSLVINIDSIWKSMVEISTPVDDIASKPSEAFSVCVCVCVCLCL